MASAQTYKGQQLVLSSGRLLLNARSDSTFISARKYINLSAGDKVTIDVGPDDSDNEENMFLVNSPKIQFGLNRFGKPEQVVKSDELKKILIELIDKINNFNKLMSTAAVTSPTPIFATLYKTNSSKLTAELLALKGKLDNFKSKITYTI